MFFVYALYSEKFDKIYVGFSSDIQKRINAHNDERNSGWTAKYKPWIIIYSEKWDNKRDALRREKELKSFKGRAFIREIIQKH